MPTPTLRDNWEKLKTSTVSVFGMGYLIVLQNIDNIPIDDDFMSTGLLGSPPNSNRGMSNPRNLHTCK